MKGYKNIPVKVELMMLCELHLDYEQIKKLSWKVEIKHTCWILILLFGVWFKIRKNLKYKHISIMNLYYIKRNVVIINTVNFTFDSNKLYSSKYYKKFYTTYRFCI